MPITALDWMKDAHANHYAIPAFDYSSLWDVRAVVEAAKEERSPVILMTLSYTDEWLPAEIQAPYLAALAAAADVPVFTHVDHSVSEELCRRAVLAGYDSVMIDASKQSLPENIRRTESVVRFAHERGVCVEAEIGRIKGKSVEGEFVAGEDFLVQVPDAVELVRSTGVDILAVGVGSAHGFYTEAPSINQTRLAEVNAALGIPLVMHGGTGIPAEMMRESIKNGISKVNVGTDILTAYSRAMQKNLAARGGNASILPGVTEAVEAVKEVARMWIRVCMADGRVK